jgi:hypothetical protein
MAPYPIAKMQLHDPNTANATTEEKLSVELTSVLVIWRYEKGFHSLGNRKSSVIKRTRKILVEIMLFCVDHSRVDIPTLDRPKIRCSQILPPSKATAKPAAAAALQTTKVDMGMMDYLSYLMLRLYKLVVQTIDYVKGLEGEEMEAIDDNILCDTSLMSIQWYVIIFF